MHIVRVHPDHEDILGARVIAFGNTPVKAALQRANRYFGGQQNWRTYMSTAILESPALLEAAGIAGDGDAVSLTLETMKGATLEVSLDPLAVMETPDMRGIFPWMVLADRQQPGEQVPWGSLARTWDETPLYLARPKVPYFHVENESLDSLYIHLAFLLDTTDYSIAEFWKALEEHLAGRQYRTIVLDLRHNPGGDFNTSVGPVARLADHLTADGRLFIATSRATFSAAIVNTSVARFHGGDRAIIIGERVGDRDQFWAEGGFPFRLPHSGLGVSFATGFHDWVNGCIGKHPYCYDGNKGVENPVSSLDPDLYVPLTFDDYARGNDPVMMAIRSYKSE